MAGWSSRRNILTCVATGVAGLFGGCSGFLSDSPSGTATSSDGTVSLEYIGLTNWTETKRRATITVSRDGQTVHTETLEVKPVKTDDENVQIQGSKYLHGPYLNADGDYTVEFAVKEQHATANVYRERTPESHCYFVEGEISPAGDDYLLHASSYARESTCETFD